jgi:hypothetical protein
VLPAQVLRELEALCERVGLVVREEPFGRLAASRGGGLCKVKGKPIVLLDAGLPVVDKIAVLTAVLGEFDLEAIYVAPFLRAKIEKKRSNRKTGRREGIRGLAKARRREHGA